MSKKVRFSCPRCLTVLQTDEDRVGCQIGCPHCSFQFQLTKPDAPTANVPQSNFVSDPSLGSTVVSADGGAANLGERSTVDHGAGTSGFSQSVSDSLSGAQDFVASNPVVENSVSSNSNIEDSVYPHANHPNSTVSNPSDSRSSSFVDLGPNRPGPPPCPHCHSQAPALIKSEVSVVGWIIFAILLMTTVVFCWIGVLIRDKYRVCSYCKIRLGPQ